MWKTYYIQFHLFLQFLNNQYFLGNGEWTAWENEWSKCSKSCTQSKERSCENPSPAFGGEECSGNAKKFQFCKEDDCEGYYTPYRHGHSNPDSHSTMRVWIGVPMSVNACFFLPDYSKIG